MRDAAEGVDASSLVDTNRAVPTACTLVIEKIFGQSFVAVLRFCGAWIGLLSQRKRSGCIQEDDHPCIKDNVSRLGLSKNERSSEARCEWMMLQW